jgi:hypothetical protein
MDRIERLTEIIKELGEIANSYAGEETGTEATLLHLASGNIYKTIDSLNGKRLIDPLEVVKVYMKWSRDLAMLELLKH